MRITRSSVRGVKRLNREELVRLGKGLGKPFAQRFGKGGGVNRDARPELLLPGERRSRGLSGASLSHT